MALIITIDLGNLSLKFICKVNFYCTMMCTFVIVLTLLVVII